MTRSTRWTQKLWRWGTIAVIAIGGLAHAGRAAAQEPPYLVTYSDALEEPGNLEIAVKNLQAAPTGGNAFFSSTLELEYGVKAWWTTEVYLSGQSTSQQSTLFTGFRWENRFRPLLRQHRFNPVLYLEYENISDADRSILEVEGHDGIGDLLVPNAQARKTITRELETKLILSSDVRGWNISENFIATKNFNGDPWEFGYAFGVSRPLALKASSRECWLCRENFAAGAEIYGGLGDTHDFGLHATSHYAGPVVVFNMPKGPSITFSPSFGLNGNSVGVLYRFKVSYEVQQVVDYFRRGKS